jgi:hypothetical protein
MAERHEAIYATTAAAADERRALLRLSTRSDARGLAQLALHLAALLATGTAVALARGS